MPHKLLRKMLTKRLIALVLATTAGMAAFSLIGQKEVYVGTRVRATTPLEQIDHSGWDRLLKAYVNEHGMVNYGRWATNIADRRSLEQYLAHLSTGKRTRTSSADAVLAFWINAYNAVTIHGILREYPTSSIRNHTPSASGYNIWKHLQLFVDGHPYSLNRIEHEILLKMNESRVHFAIVCASVGCPRLLNESYKPNSVQNQLDTSARKFFLHPRNFRYSDGEIQLSSILKWFASDFGSNQSDQLKTIARWLPTQAAQKVAVSGRLRVSYLDYDWHLNEQH
ncbi:MAG: DUF547 domain-containing protein [Fuerstiella sp.]|nr:DUF547 domain-containing protein [Fuerstiella sp.]